MCTIVLAKGCVPGYPLVIAHARDELLARPFSPPSRLPFLPEVVAPRDETAGGTWLGLRDSGLVVAVTNRFGAPPDPTRRSRGLLALEALVQPTGAAAHAGVLAHLATRAYRGFNLLIADRERAYLVAREDGAELDLALDLELADGLHLVTSFEHLNPPSLAARRAELEAAAAAGYATFLAATKRVLASHAPEGAGYPICKHLEQHGTVCAAIISIAAAGSARFEFAAGPPCRASFVEVA